MNDLATGLLVGLARTTVLLAAAAVAVCWLLRWSRASSPGIHRVAWCLVLLQGWLWFRLPVEIPCYEAPQEEPASVAVGPAVPAESPGGWGKSHRVPETTDEAFPGNSPPATRHSSPATRHQASALSAGTAGPTEAAPPLWPAILAAVWLGGMGLMVAGWVGCYLVFLGFLPRGQRAEADWIDQWEELLRSRGVRRAIPMRVTARIGPVLCRLPWG